MALSFTHAILEWARSKPADEAYDYCSPDSCAISQFLRDTGRAAKPMVALNRWDDWSSKSHFPLRHKFDTRIDDAAIDAGADFPDRTFGGFAKRLEALV